MLLPWTACLALDAKLSLEQFNHTKWTVREQGPGQIGAIAQTSDGYLWLGANYSLYRFDGVEFERFVSSDGDAVATVSQLLASPDGSLWIGKRFGGVSVLRDGQLVDYPPGQDLPEGAVYALAVDHDGAVWAAANAGLARFNGQRWEIVDTGWNFPEESARSVFVDRDGTTWAASDDRLFYLPKGEHRFIDTGESIGWVTDIVQSPDGAIWISQMYPGAVRQVATGKTPAEISLDVAPSGLLFDSDGMLWIGTHGGGLVRVSTPGTELSTEPEDRLRQEDGLSSDVVGLLFEDREGIVWAGTSTGLDRFKYASAVPACISSGAYNVALAATPDGAIWAGSSNQPVTRLLNGQARTAAPALPVTAAATDQAGTVWMGGPGGIWRSRGEELLHVTYLPVEDPAEAAVRALTMDRSGTLWVSINRSGLFTWKEGAWTQPPPVSDASLQQMPVVAATDEQGRAWFGYRDNLLVRREGESIRIWDGKDGLKVGHVTALFHSERGVWLGGNEGLGLLSGEGFIPIESETPSLLRGIHAVIEVANGDLWLHSAAAVIMVPATELQRALAENGYKVRLRSFERIDRLPDDPFRIHPLPTAISSADGRLWFASASGVMWLDPANLHDSQTLPTVAIKRVAVDTEPLVIGQGESVLPPRPGHLVIDYAGLHFAAPEALRYRYRLTGYDNRWQDVGGQRRAIYTGLGPGSYRFEVEAITGQGLPSVQPASLAFRIPPVIYNSPLFKMFYVMIGAGLLWSLYILRLRYLESNLRARLEERHRERERIARELHDTLLQGFQGLVLQFQAIAEKLDRTAPLRIQMERALDRADEALAEGRDRVRNLRDGSNKDLMGRLTDVAQSLVPGDASPLKLVLKGTAMPLNPIVHDEIYWIAREAIINASKHAQASEIRVIVTFGTAAFQLKVRDNGAGLELRDGKEDPAGHWGLRGMQERADWIGGSIKIASEKDKGTEVRLQVPGDRAYRSDVRQIPRWLRPIIYGRRKLWRHPVR